MYTALYRKKRPSTFSDIVGQWSIVRTLCNQLRGGNISHAYLFCGTRGTGKTSTAKIFARAVNCPESKESGEPCNSCEICQDILAERNFNVIEIDAASNNGVDNIRDLREEVKYPPTVGTYKVYIIDEAHMLTTAAFNALLKTLEEPPGHIIFIFATTDPAKIPATILSRCQRYDFKRITKNDMVSTLAAYMEKEGRQAETEALEYIASVSDGAMRDALSILDQCLSLYPEEDITLTKVQDLLGAVDQSSLFAYSEALFQGNPDAALQIIAKAAKDGRDFSRFTSDIITHLRNLLVAGQISEHTDILDYSAETVTKYREQGSQVPSESLIKSIYEFSELQNQMRFLPKERLALEVCTIKLCDSKNKAIPYLEVKAESKVESKSASDVDSKAESKVESKVESEKIVSEIESIKKVSQEPILKEVAIKEMAITDVTIKEVTIKDAAIKWKDFCSGLSGLLKSMLSLCDVECSGTDSLTIKCRDQASLQYIKEQKGQIAAELIKYFGLQTEPGIVFAANDGYNDDDTFKENLQKNISMEIEWK